LGEATAERGLKTNPNHPVLTNNKAFGQILQGKLAEGIATLATLDLERTNLREKICLLATTGLAHFRLGKAEEGRKFYRTAIILAKDPEYFGLRTIAALYLATEEALLGEKQGFIEFKRAYTVAERLKQTIIPAIADHLAPEVEKAASRHRIDLQIRTPPKREFVQIKDGDLFSRFGKSTSIINKPESWRA